AFTQETARNDHRFEVRLDDEVTAEFFHDDHGFVGAAAKTALLFGERGCEKAEVRELFPDLGTPTFSRLSHLAACLEIIFVAEQALHGVAEQGLLLGERKIHLFRPSLVVMFLSALATLKGRAPFLR